jgi:hypothetical protein
MQVALKGDGSISVYRLVDAVSGRLSEAYGQ